MPNHCQNNVTISCDSQTAELIRNLLKGEETEFDFNKLIPMPEELLECSNDPKVNLRRKQQYGHDGWYDWRLANWGTKWNSYECTLDEMIDDGILEYRFDTAWGPPEGIHTALMKYIETHDLRAEVTWFYDEPLMEFAGYL